MHHPIRRHPTRDRIVDVEVMKLELQQAQLRVVTARRARPIPEERADAPELHRAA